MELIEMFLQNAMIRKDRRLMRYVNLGCVKVVVCLETKTACLRGRVPNTYLIQLAISAVLALTLEYGLALINEIQIAHS